MTETPVSEATPVVRDWIRDRAGVGVAVDQAVELVRDAAKAAAAELTLYGRSAVTLSPANGWTYQIICSVHDDPRLPGNLLIALPEWNTCLLLNDHFATYHVPGYVAEKCQATLGTTHHAAIVAAFATLLSEQRAYINGA